MERDFLGINSSKDLENRGNRQDSAYLGSSAIQWPFSNKVAALQQFMSFRAVQEEKPLKMSFEHLPSSGFQPVTAGQAFEPSYKASTAQQSPQKCFSLDGRQFSMHAHQSLNNDLCGASTHYLASHPSIPVSTSGPFLKVHGSSSGLNLPVATLKQLPNGGTAANNSTIVGSGARAFASRNVNTKPSTTTAQLTIFYAGSVNVYDGVPLDKAQAIMFLASKGCNTATTSNGSNLKQEAPMPAIFPPVAAIDCFGMSSRQTQAQAQNLNNVSSSISVCSYGGANSRSGSSTTDEVGGVKNVGPLQTLPSQHEAVVAATAAVSVLPRAVPQARKASLARFLEKRKERVTNALPYKKSPENSTAFEGSNVPSKCSSVDVSLSSKSNQEESWCSIQPKKSNSNSNIGDPPSTKLEM